MGQGNRRVWGGLLILVTAHAGAEEPEVMVPKLVMEQGITDEGAGEVDLSQVVLSAGKRVESVQETASIVTVVTRDQIVARGYRTLSDVINDLPGFEAYRPTQMQAPEEAMARGNAGTILVLWNGVPLNSPRDNRRALGRSLPLSVVHRVEVLSGPGGVVWGANAFLGIINVITLRADSAPSRAEVTLAGGDGRGDQESLGASAQVTDSFLQGRVKVLANLTFFTSRDAAIRPTYDVVLGTFPPPDNDSALTLRESMGLSANARDVYLPFTMAVDMGSWRLDLFYPLVLATHREFTHLTVRTDYNVDNLEVRRPGGVHSDQIDRIGLLSLQRQSSLGANAHLTSRVYLSGFENLWSSEPSNGPGELTETPVTGIERYGENLPILLDGAYRVGATIDASRTKKSSDLIGGAEVYLEGMRSTHLALEGGLVNVPESKISLPGHRLIVAAFVDDKLRLGKRFQIGAGLRGQYSPGAYDPLLLASLAVLWNPTQKVYLKLNVAQGFRPPPLFFILGNDDATTNPIPHRQANRALEAERSVALETEISAIVLRHHRRYQYLALRLGYQVTRIDDLIIMQNAVSANAGRRLMHSVETRADLALTGNHRVTTAYSYLSGYDAETGPVRHIANHKLHVGAETRLYQGLDAMLSATVLGPREDLNRLAIPTGGASADRFLAPASSVTVDRLPPALVLRAGLRAASPFGLPMDVSLFVHNLFDASLPTPDQDFDKRESPFLIPSAGRSAYLQVAGRL